MKAYERYIKVRKPINRFGKLGYVGTYEYVLTDEIETFNYKKKIRFIQTREAAAFFQDPLKKPDTVYQVEEPYKGRTW